MKRKKFSWDSASVITSQHAGDCLTPYLLKNQYICAECGFSQILALKIKPVIAAKAKENLSTHTSEGYQPLANLPNPESVNTQKELAEMADVSPRNMAKIEKLVDNATPETNQAVRAGSKHMETQGVYMDF